MASNSSNSTTTIHPPLILQELLPGTGQNIALIARLVAATLPENAVPELKDKFSSDMTSLLNFMRLAVVINNKAPLEAVLKNRTFNNSGLPNATYIRALENFKKQELPKLTAYQQEFANSLQHVIFKLRHA